MLCRISRAWNIYPEIININAINVLFNNKEMMMPHMLDVDQKDFEYKMSKTILMMPEEV